MSLFTKAKRSLSKLRLAVVGISGVGKSYSALLIAKGLGGRVAVIDTENNSAALYSDLVDFDVLNMRHDDKGGYHPNRYVEYIKAAEAEGYDVLIIDSISPEWEGENGMLQLSHHITQTKTRGNSFIAWNLVNPFHVNFVNAILQSRMHIIVTIKQKTDYVMSQDGNGKTIPIKVGLKPIQRENFEYDYSVVLEINMTHHAIASKDRTRLFSSETPFLISEETGKELRNWLMHNVDADLEKPRTQADYSDAPILDDVQVSDTVPQDMSVPQELLTDDDSVFDEKTDSVGAVEYTPDEKLVNRLQRWVAKARELNSFSGAYDAAKREYKGQDLDYVLKTLKAEEDSFVTESVK